MEPSVSARAARELVTGPSTNELSWKASVRAPLPRRPRTTSAAARRTVSVVNSACAPSPMSTTRPRPSGRWRTVSSRFLPFTSRRFQAAARSPAEALSASAREGGRRSSFPSTSNTPTAAASADAAVASRRSTPNFMRSCPALERGADLVAVDPDPGGRDGDEVLRDPRDVAARVLGDVLEVETHPLHGDLVVSDGGVVQEDDIALVGELRDLVEVLEPKDLGESNRSLRAGERAGLVLERHRAEVEKAALFECVRAVVPPENTAFFHHGRVPRYRRHRGGVAS